VSRFARHRTALQGLLLGTAGAVVTICAMLWADGRAERAALEELEFKAQTAATLNAAIIRNSFERYRELPFVLSETAEIADVLTQPSESAIEALDARLESLAAGIGASAIYLLNDKGLAIAASNWREPATFVGVDYQFRPYFQDALIHGKSQYFALGTISHEPGLYFSQRVADAGGSTLGVVVVKVDFQRLEAVWKKQNAPTFVTDKNGVLLLTSHPAWRFRTLLPLAPDVSTALRDSLQFGPDALQSVPSALASPEGPIPPEEIDLPSDTYWHTVTPVEAIPDWTLHLYTPADGAIANAKRDAKLLAFLSCLLMLSLAYMVWRRSHFARQRRAEEKRTRARLETLVGERTSALSRSNAQLAAEIEQRAQSQARVELLQDEVAQANKLAILGQVSASVAHEINQPVSAIRTYADNAQLMLANDQIKAAHDNLAIISNLTQRIGGITQSLRSFAKREPACPMPARVSDAVEGALLILNARLTKTGVALQCQGLEQPIYADVGLIRIEQILINLLQNAIDALEQSPNPKIELSVSQIGSVVRISVADNGTGLSEAVMGKLFTPFSSQKKEGLGLGLVISRDLIRDAKGDLVAHNAPDGGAVFVLTVPAAQNEKRPQ